MENLVNVLMGKVCNKKLLEILNEMVFRYTDLYHFVMGKMWFG